MRRLALLLLVSVSVAACQPTTPDDDGEYPQRDVTMIVPFGAGGGSDVFLGLDGPDLFSWNPGYGSVTRSIDSGLADIRVVPM